MPNFDGTGPNGEGPLTGRGAGDCGTPRGGRRGLWGRCFRRWSPFCRRAPQAIDEKEALKQEIEDTKDYLESLEEEEKNIDKE